MFTKPPFVPIFFGVLLVPLIIWIVVTPGITEEPCLCPQAVASTQGAATPDALRCVPPNKRLKLPARVQY
jgi:hypothetical protein